MFQSRNRETYDSNQSLLLQVHGELWHSFNLVIEKLLIPTGSIPKGRL